MKHEKENIYVKSNFIYHYYFYSPRPTNSHENVK